MASEPIARRDAGLRRVARMTRTAVAGGVAATGVFAALAAHAFSGTTAQQSTTPGTTIPDQTQGATPSSPSVGQSTPTTVTGGTTRRLLDNGTEASAEIGLDWKDPTGIGTRATTPTSTSWRTPRRCTT